VPALILILAIAFGVFLCACVLALVATSRRVGWRDVLSYFGLADPPPPPDEDLLSRPSPR
jgi:hypothetical protein